MKSMAANETAPDWVEQRYLVDLPPLKKQKIDWVKYEQSEAASDAHLLLEKENLELTLQVLKMQNKKLLKT